MSTGFLLLPVGYAPTDNGAVIPNGKLTFSRSGTSTLQNTYSDSALTVPNANPVVLNAEGFLDTNVYGDPSTGFNYRIKLTDSADVSTGFGTVDDVTGDVDDTRLSANVPLLNASNSFTAKQIITLTGAALSARSAAGASKHTSIEYIGTDAGSSTATYYTGVNPFGTDGAFEIKPVTGTDGIRIATSGAVTIAGVASTAFARLSLETAANLASAAASINTAAKFAGKLVLDTTNHKLYTARGANATDPWDLADGSAAVTPS